MKSLHSLARWVSPDLLLRALSRGGETSLLRRPLADDEWQGCLATVREVVVLGGAEVFNGIGERIAGLIQAIDPVMTEYCRRTCPRCADPCCNGRKVFFNRTDLIYLAAIGETSVPGQTRSRPDHPCRYLGVEGCGLSRRLRPYVCVWFFCEPQMELLQAESPRFQRRITDALQEIRQARLVLETLYEECASRFGA